jgi:hypothetical protein
VLVNPAGIADPTGAYENAADPAYDDSAWRSVDLPHDWSIDLDPTTGAGTGTGTSSETGFLQIAELQVVGDEVATGGPTSAYSPITPSDGP